MMETFYPKTMYKIMLDKVKNYTKLSFWVDDNLNVDEKNCSFVGSG